MKTSPRKTPKPFCEGDTSESKSSDPYSLPLSFFTPSTCASDDFAGVSMPSLWTSPGRTPCRHLPPGPVQDRRDPLRPHRRFVPAGEQRPPPDSARPLPTMPPTTTNDGVAPGHSGRCQAPRAPHRGRGPRFADMGSAAARPIARVAVDPYRASHSALRIAGFALGSRTSRSPARTLPRCHSATPGGTLGARKRDL